MRRALALCALPIAAVIGLAAPSVAGPHAKSSATLTVSTSGSAGALATTSASTGSSLVFAGCGYQAGVGVTVTVQSPTAISFFGAIAGDDGCFSTAATENYTATAAGDYTASSFQSSRKRPDATVTFSVVG